MADRAVLRPAALLTRTRVVDTVAHVDAMNREVEARFDAANASVLCVGQEPDLLAHVRSALADRYNVFFAYDGANGLERAREYRPDVIVTEQMMARMGGRELLVAIRADESIASIPVAFLTTQYDPGRVETFDAGADDYIAKPFHEAELRARVENLVRSRRHERELAELNRRLRLQVREHAMQRVQASELERFVPRQVISRIVHDGSRPVPVRRRVTVVVADLAVLSELGERLDATGVTTVTNEYFAAISAICVSRGGTVDGLAGGRLSVLFGAFDDVAPEEAALSAIAVAGEIRRRLMDLSAAARRRGIADAHPRGIGVGTGTCIVGAFGGDALRTFTAVGRAAQIAAKLQAIAAPGAIVCDDASVALLEHRVRTRAVAAPTLSRDERAYQLVELAGSADAPESSVEPVGLPRASAPPNGECMFRREGDYWTVVYSGRVFRLKHSKGAASLAHLLARPHVEIHVFELARATALDEPDPRSISPTHAAELGLSTVARELGPVLDDRAKKAYRARLDELEEELHRARHLGDIERGARAEEARSAIARELASAIGLRGRDRKTLAPIERLRVNVTRTVRAVISRIGRNHPELGRLLTETVSTGTFCVYAPRPGLPDEWRVAP